jgi:hypothetical protein
MTYYDARAFVDAFLLPPQLKQQPCSQQKIVQSFSACLRHHLRSLWPNQHRELNQPTSTCLPLMAQITRRMTRFSRDLFMQWYVERPFHSRAKCWPHAVRPLLSLLVNCTSFPPPQSCGIPPSLNTHRPYSRLKRTRWRPELPVNCAAGSFSKSGTRASA